MQELFILAVRNERKSAKQIAKEMTPLPPIETTAKIHLFINKGKLVWSNCCGRVAWAK